MSALRDGAGQEARNLLQPGERMVGVVPIFPHRKLAEPPRRYWPDKPRPHPLSWLGTALLAVLDYLIAVFTDGSMAGGYGSGNAWIQRRFRFGGWESQAGRTRIAICSTRPKDAARVSVEAVVTDRRLILRWVQLGDVPSGAATPALPVIAEFRRDDGPDAVHVQTRRRGHRVDLVFGDGSWFSVNDLKDRHKELLRLLGER